MRFVMHFVMPIVMPDAVIEDDASCGERSEVYISTTDESKGHLASGTHLTTTARTTART
jgi:hypothetical protein